MSSEERYQRFEVRRRFYAELREASTSPGPEPLRSETEAPNPAALVSDTSPSTPVSSRPARGSIVSRPFKAFTLQLADHRASISTPNRTAVYSEYTKPHDFRASRWLHRLGDRRFPHRCICIHGIAGSHVDFLPWKSKFEDAGVELYAACLPGRSIRCMEPSIPFVQHAAHAIVDALVELEILSTARSLSFYGHSVGALIAYECIQRLFVNYSSMLPPIHLFVSSCPNPISLSNFNKDPFVTKTCELSNQQLYNVLLNEKWLNEDILRRINTLFVALFRSDLKLFENYITHENNGQYAQNLLKDVPLVTFEFKFGDIIVIFSEDFYFLRQNNFEYAWDSVSRHTDTMYLRYDSLNPYSFLKEQNIMDAILSATLNETSV